jgi:hypothetical protein
MDSISRDSYTAQRPPALSLPSLTQRLCDSLPLSARIFIPAIVVCSVFLLLSSLLARLGKRLATSSHPDDQLRLLPSTATENERSMFRTLCVERDRHIQSAAVAQQKDRVKAVAHLASALAYDASALHVAKQLGTSLEPHPGLRRKTQETMEKIAAHLQIADAYVAAQQKQQQQSPYDVDDTDFEEPRPRRRSGVDAASAVTMAAPPAMVFESKKERNISSLRSL